MDYFLKQSIELANQKDYLDQLFKVYPLSPDNIREINSNKWDIFQKAFKNDNQEKIIESLLDFELFPIKDSYIAYLRRDKSAIKRNPLTVARICGRLKEMGLDIIYEKLSQPKETNRQIGPLFKRFVNSGVLGVKNLELEEFVSTKDNAVLKASDLVMREFAKKNLAYNREKGLDFIAKFNNKIIIGEAKFLSDFGGHQNAQLEDALSLLELSLSKNVIKIALLDGVCYIQNNSKMQNKLQVKFKNSYIFSSLLLRDFLYQV